MLRALGSASCDLKHKTGGTVCSGHWVLRLVISHTRQQDWNTRNPESLPASSCESHGGAGQMKYAPSGTNSFDLSSRAAGHIFLCHTQSHHCTQSRSVATNTPTPPRPSTQLLRLVISHTRQGVRFGTGIGLCVLGYHTRDSEHDLLRALRSASFDITEETGRYDLFRALGSAFCDITHETGGTICYGHWVLRLVISHTRQGYGFLGALGSASCDITHETTGTIVPGIGFCVM